MQMPLPSLSFFSQASFHLGFFPVGVVGLPVADALGSRFGFLGMGLGSSGLRLGCSARGLCSGFGLGASKCGNTFPAHCQILKGAKVQLFQGRKQNLYSF